jgi:Glycosyltransferase family 9 (heptosyltransferase)
MARHRLEETRPTALVLRSLGLGDFFTGLPALRMLRDVLPGHRIVLALGAQFAPLALRAGTVDSVLCVGELQPLDGGPVLPDVAVDLHGNGPASSQLLAARHPRRLVAFAEGTAEWSDEEYEPHRWCRLVETAFGWAVRRYPSVFAALPIPDVSVPPGQTVLHCSAKSPAREWPPHRFTELASRLRTAGHRVVVTAPRVHAERAAAIAAASGTAYAADLSLDQLLALVARARLVVCGDTGVGHVATNYGTPSVVLFGPVSPAVWGPPPELPRHQVLWHGDGRGDPHGTELDPALARIGVDEVEAAVERALAAAAATVAHRGGGGGLGSVA